MYPLLLKPVIKNYIWGGDRLIREFGYECEAPAAEAWMLSCREGSVNTVLNGEYKGRLLSEVPWVDAAKFPLLVKLIDAADDLSVQVHPSAECAAKYEGDSEKAEMWYVIDCADGSSLVHGFNDEIGKLKKDKESDQTYFSEIEKRVKEGKISDILRRVAVHPDDVFFVEPGTVHAIGRGILLAEVQLNSDTTYRVYDYGRLGRDGKPRELHVDKALEAIRLADGARAGFTDATAVTAGAAVRRLSCGLFSADLVTLDGKLKERSDKFFSAVILSGAAEISWRGGTLDVSKGDSVYVPEDCAVTFSGECRMLISRPA